MSGPRGITERNLVRIFVQILSSDPSASRAVTDLFGNRTPPGHPISVPVDWAREVPLGRHQWSVDAVGWSADRSPGIVVEAKSKRAPFQLGQASGYGEWQQEKLPAGGFGVLAFVVPADRSDDIWTHVRNELPEAEPTGDVFVIPGEARVAVVRATWDDVLEALWLTVAAGEHPASRAAIAELVTACAISEVSAPSALSANDLGHWSERLPDPDVLVAAVCAAVTARGIPTFLRQPAGGGFLTHRYVGLARPWLSIGVREDASGGELGGDRDAAPLALWARWNGDVDRVVRALEGTRWKPQVTPADGNRGYVWVPLPVTPADGPGRGQIDELAESVVELWHRTGA